VWRSPFAPIRGSPAASAAAVNDAVLDQVVGGGVELGGRSVVVALVVLLADLGVEPGVALGGERQLGVGGTVIYKVRGAECGRERAEATEVV